MAADAIILPIINQLRAYCAPLGGNVAGAADFRLGLQKYNENMPLPAGYVLPLDQVLAPDENVDINGRALQEYVLKTYGIVVEFDATSDRRGQNPTMQYEDIEAGIFASILNWAPSSLICRVPGGQGFYFSGGRFLDLDRARLFYQWEFTVKYQITDEDGWHDPTPLVDLAGVQLNIYHKPGAAPIDPVNDVPAAEVLVATNPPMDPLGPPPWPYGWPEFEWEQLR